MSRPDKDRAPRKSNGSTESAEGKGRPGMPNEASVLSEKSFTSPKGRRYRIIKTDETDPYDAPLSPEEKRRKRR
jgi:hypothetical protein